MVALSIQNKYQSFIEKEHNYDLCYAIDNTSDLNYAVSAAAAAIPAKVSHKSHLLGRKIVHFGSKALEKTYQFFSRPGVQRALLITGIVIGILTIPVAIKYIYDSTKELIAVCKSKEREFIIDNAVDISQGVGYLAGSIIGIAAVTIAQTAKWVPIANLVVAVISAIGSIKYAMNGVQAILERSEAKKMASSKEIDSRYLETKNYLESLTSRQVMKYYWADKEWLLDKFGALETADRDKKVQLLALVDKVNKAALVSQFLYAASGALWLGSALSIVIPTAQVAAPFLFLVAAVTSLASDAFSWYQWRSFKNSVEKL